jgi:hypothetical protein
MRGRDDAEPELSLSLAQSLLVIVVDESLNPIATQHQFMAKFGRVQFAKPRESLPEMSPLLRLSGEHFCNSGIRMPLPPLRRGALLFSPAFGERVGILFSSLLTHLP